MQDLLKEMMQKYHEKRTRVFKVVKFETKITHHYHYRYQKKVHFMPSIRKLDADYLGKLTTHKFEAIDQIKSKIINPLI
jgi:hypothetical protein